MRLFTRPGCDPHPESRQASLLAVDTVHDLSGWQLYPGRTRSMKGKNMQNKNFVIIGSSVYIQEKTKRPLLSVLFKNGLILALNSLDPSPI